MFERGSRRFALTTLPLVAVTIAAAAWTRPHPGLESTELHGHPSLAIEVLEEGATAWRPLHRPASEESPSAEDAACTLNLSASNSGPRTIGVTVGGSQVRTQVGWWKKFDHPYMQVASGGRGMWKADVSLACNAKRRFKFSLWQTAGGGQPSATYAYYYPSSSTFTASGTVDLRLGDLYRFFR